MPKIPLDDQNLIDEDLIDPNMIDPSALGNPWAIAPRGGVSKNSRTEKSESKSNTTKNLYDPEGIASRASAYEDLPFMKEQKSAIADLENQLKMQAAVTGNRSNSDAWVRPFLGLVDAQTGSKMSANYKPPVDQSAKLADAQEGLLRRRNDYTKNLTELIKQKEGTQSDSSLASLASIIGQGGAGTDPNFRYENQAHQRNISALKMNPTFRQNLVSAQKIENGLNNAVGVDKLTPQSFHELQQAIRGSITKGAGGVAERGETYYKNLNMSADQFLQWLESKPKNLSKNDPFVQHVLQIGQMELGNIKRQNMEQAKMLLKGNASVYAARPDLKADLDDLLGATEDLMTPNINPKVQERMPKKKITAPNGMQAPEGAAKPKTIKQGEHTYTLNEATGGYE